MYYSEGSRWKLIMACYTIVTLLAISFREKITNGFDLLNGKDTVKQFLIVYAAVLAVTLIALAVFIIMLVRMGGLHQSDSMMKVISVVGSGIIVLMGVGIIGMDFFHAASDYFGGSEKYTPSSYVLCTNIHDECFVAFADSGEYCLVQIPEDAYELMSEGEKRGSTDSSELYSLVEEANYYDEELYDGGFEISYYKNTTVFDSVSQAG